ncbi:MAG: SDR family oxidoreductase [Bacillota bacterium]|nr:SDR family oxidoreductase [Bacillota bacterium]
MAGIFQGKAALVTGGGTGLGYAMSRMLLEEGARVVIASRNRERLDGAAAELRRTTGGEALAMPLDVRDAEAVERVVEAAVERFGRLDFLVNNAAGNFVVRAEELSPRGWDAVVGIVLDGSFYCSRAFGRHAIRRGGGGAILNVVASYAWTGGPGTVHSAAAKAGVLAMTRTLAVEWAPFGIRVNAIAPGPVPTEGAASHLFPGESDLRALEAQVPLGRLGTPEDVARAARFLLSEEASWITGEVLTVDGGQWLGKGMFRVPAGGSPHQGVDR